MSTTISHLLPNGDTKRLVNGWIRNEAVLRAKLRVAGVIENNEVLNARMAAPGDITSFPFYNALTGDSVVGSDDLTEKITPGNLTGDELLVSRMTRNKAWGGADLTKLVSGLDPVAAIVDGVASWLALDEEKIMMSVLNGVVADMAQNDAASFIVGDHTVKLDADLLADARQLKGERKEALTKIIMHSAVENQLQKDNQITNVPPSDQRGSFKVYQGMEVIVSDSMPTATANATTVYTSIVCAPNVISLGEADMGENAVASVRDELGGNGQGGETLVFRRTFGATVNGYSYVGAARPSNSTLAAHASWVRKYDPALIGISVIKSKL